MAVVVSVWVEVVVVMSVWVEVLVVVSVCMAVVVMVSVVVVVVVSASMLVEMLSVRAMRAVGVTVTLSVMLVLSVSVLLHGYDVFLILKLHRRTQLRFVLLYTVWEFKWRHTRVINMNRSRLLIFKVLNRSRFLIFWPYCVGECAGAPVAKFIAVVQTPHLLRWNFVNFRICLLVTFWKKFGLDLQCYQL